MYKAVTLAGGIREPLLTCSSLIEIMFILKAKKAYFNGSYNKQGPVVQSIVSLTSSLRGQLVKCFTTLQPNTLKFFVEKMREAFALQKLLTFFQQKILANLRY